MPRLVSAQVSSVAIRGDHRVVGVFGLIHIEEVPDAARSVRHPHLTPRQQEVLGYLAQGCSTDQIAANQGTQFDPDVVDAFEASLPGIRRVRRLRPRVAPPV